MCALACIPDRARNRSRWRSRAASTRLRIAALGSPGASPPSSAYGTAGPRKWMSIRSSCGPEIRAWYRSTNRRPQLHTCTGLPSWPQGHPCVAILPAGLTAKIPKPGYPRQLKHLGDHIRARRIDQNLRQLDVADRLGAERDSLRNWEKGRTEPDVKFLPAVIASWATIHSRKRGPTYPGPGRRGRHSKDGMAALEHPAAA